jgi:hypothetical protein
MSRHRVPAVAPLPALFVALGFLLGPAPAAHAQPAQPTRPAAPQELDPLTADEKAIAERIVRGDARARELLGERATLASIEFLALKGRRPDEVLRHADLLFSRPDGDFGARAIVRLGAETGIVEFTRVDRKSVPMTEADVQEVFRIALADPEYRRKLNRSPDGLRPEALRIYTENRNDPCFSGRCFYLILRDGDFYVSAASVTVDLTTKRILAERSPK